MSQAALTRSIPRTKLCEVIKILMADASDIIINDRYALSILPAHALSRIEGEKELKAEQSTLVIFLRSTDSIDFDGVKNMQGG